MRRVVFTLVSILMSTAICSAAMSKSRMRQETRFLTDKMAYELNLTTAQYNDVYEINYDFLDAVRYLLDDVADGYEWALNEYYDYLDMRNDDLRWVLSSYQYGQFLRAAYFYRPVYVTGGRWAFRIYSAYTNPRHFFFPKPYHYRTYAGAHSRIHYRMGFYNGRHDMPHYNGTFRIHGEKGYRNARRSDFGNVPVRPNSNHPQGGNKQMKQPDNKQRITTGRTSPRRERSNDNMYTVPQRNNRVESGSREQKTQSSQNNSREQKRQQLESSNKQTEVKSNRSNSRRSSSTTRSSSTSSRRSSSRSPR